MKLLFIYLLLISLISCNITKDTEGSNIKSKHNYNNEIYRTNSKFTFEVFRIKDSDTLNTYSIISTKGDALKDKDSINAVVINKVVLTVIPGTFFKQTKIKWEYYRPDGMLVAKSITGLKENEDYIWLHPPRTGTLKFMEAAPFPKFYKSFFEPQDTVQEKSWTSSLTLVKGYEEIGLEGDVATSYNFKDKFVKENFSTSFKTFDKVFEVKSIGESSIGKVKHNFFFHEKYGWVYSEVILPNGEILILSLLDHMSGEK